jgi:hypothetical protein
MSKIVYLIGAGASFGKRDKENKIVEGLPIVEEIPSRIQFLIHKIITGNTEINSQFKASKQDIDFLISELEWLKTASIKHQTIDTYAKKLYTTQNHEEYERLKYALSAYLTLEQLFNKPDSRYDAFFAAILGDDISKLPDFVSILSWNYDCQFEIAFAEYFSSNKSLNSIWDHLKIFNKTTTDDRKKYDNFSITKLNGTALTYDKKSLDKPFFDSFFNRMGMSKINHVITSYLRGAGASNVENALSFGWEKMNEIFKNQIISKVEDAEILVIIGYSFPYFNREVDRFIIQNMNSLNKIYIQDPNHIEVKESLEAVLSEQQLSNQMMKYVHKAGVKQFVIPNEM